MFSTNSTQNERLSSTPLKYSYSVKYLLYPVHFMRYKSVKIP